MLSSPLRIREPIREGVGGILKDWFGRALRGIALTIGGVTFKLAAGCALRLLDKLAPCFPDSAAAKLFRTDACAAAPELLSSGV